MNELRLVSDSHTVSFDCTLPGDSEWVWRHLTEPAGLRAWLADAQIEPRLGGNVRLRFHSDEALVRPNCGLLVRGVICCYESTRRLAYSWQDASRETSLFGRQGAASGSSRVTFNLTRGRGRTLLSLTHTGLAADVLSRIGSGWHAHLGLLANVLSEEGGAHVAALDAYVPRGSYIESSAPGMRA